MTETVHETLNNNWLAQREKYQQWHQLINSAGAHLKAGLAEKLGVSGKTWDELETKKKREYVELASVQSKQSSAIKSMYDEEITEIGELPFGIIVTFEHEPKSYPKSSYKLPVVVRIQDGKAQFSFWNTIENSQESMAAWLDVGQMVDALVDLLEEHFAFDPLSGAPRKRGIGFIQDGK